MRFAFCENWPPGLCDDRSCRWRPDWRLANNRALYVVESQSANSSGLTIVCVRAVFTVVDRKVENCSKESAEADSGVNRRTK